MWRSTTLYKLCLIVFALSTWHPRAFFLLLLGCLYSFCVFQKIHFTQHLSLRFWRVCIAAAVHSSPGCIDRPHCWQGPLFNTPTPRWRRRMSTVQHVPSAGPNLSIWRNFRTHIRARNNEFVLPNHTIPYSLPSKRQKFTRKERKIVFNENSMHRLIAYERSREENYYAKERENVFASVAILHAAHRQPCHRAHGARWFLAQRSINSSFVQRNLAHALARRADFLSNLCANKKSWNLCECGAQQWGDDSKRFFFFYENTNRALQHVPHGHRSTECDLINISLDSVWSPSLRQSESSSFQFSFCCNSCWFSFALPLSYSSNRICTLHRIIHYATNTGTRTREKKRIKKTWKSI